MQYKRHQNSTHKLRENDYVGLQRLYRKRKLVKSVSIIIRAERGTEIIAGLMYTLTTQWPVNEMQRKVSNFERRTVMDAGAAEWLLIAKAMSE